MNFKEFKELALQTEAPSKDATTNVAFLEVVLNLAFNVTTVVDDVKKNIYYNKPYDDGKLDSIFDAIIMTAAAARLAHKQFKSLPAEQLDAIVRPINEIMDPRFLHGVLGVYTEAGELLQTLGKQPEFVDLVNVSEEVGDLAWYLALIEDTTGIDHELALDKVINKLKTRYPDKFTTESAINRDLDAERKVLES